MKRSILLLLAGLLAVCSCKRTQEGPQKGEEQASAPAGSLELVFPYGSEKQKWIEDVTAEFNREARKSTSGKAIYVKAVPMGSGELIDDVLAGRLQAHLASPASAAFIKMGNAESKSKTGKDLIANTDNLVLSPVVIAMWKPMAEAIGWGKKPLGWSDILALARNQAGWGSFNYPQWGQFKFGHTHPQYSNSGLISLIAEVYAGANKTKGLTQADIQNPKTGEFLNSIEDSVVHYGSSTGFFATKMFNNGPQYLSAAIMYESLVVDSYSQADKLAFPVVAIYPKEGTFWSDHPVGVVERDWVTPEHRAAAKVYIDYLLAKPQQQKALQYGFRPASVDVPVTAPIDTAHGVDPQEPKTTLEVPSAALIHDILNLWQEKKKTAEVVLVMDISGSMNDEGKLPSAKQGAHQFIDQMSDGDTFSFLPFSSDITWALQDQPLKTARQQILGQIDSLYAHGGTALYDATYAGYQHLYERRGQHKIQAVVVLTDGEDNESKMKLDELISKIKFDSETHTIRVFTIAYGRDAEKKVLDKIAESTQAKSYAGTPQNIVTVFREISTFF